MPKRYSVRGASCSRWLGAVLRYCRMLLHSSASTLSFKLHHHHQHQHWHRQLREQAMCVPVVGVVRLPGEHELRCAAVLAANRLCGELQQTNDHAESVWHGISDAVPVWPAQRRSLAERTALAQDMMAGGQPWRRAGVSETPVEPCQAINQCMWMDGELTAGPPHPSPIE